MRHTHRCCCCHASRGVRGGPASLTPANARPLAVLSSSLRPAPPAVPLPPPSLGNAVDVLWEGTWWEAELRQKDSASPLQIYYLGDKSFEPKALEEYSWQASSADVRQGQVWDPAGGEWKLRTGPASAARVPPASGKTPGGRASGKRAHGGEGGDDNGGEEDTPPRGGGAKIARKAINSTSPSSEAAAAPAAAEPAAEAKKPTPAKKTAPKPKNDLLKPLLTPELVRALFVDQRRFKSLFHKCANDMDRVAALLPGCIARGLEGGGRGGGGPRGATVSGSGDTPLFIITAATAHQRFGTDQQVLSRTVITGEVPNGEEISSLTARNFSGRPPTNAQLVAFIEGELQQPHLTLQGVRSTMDDLSGVEGTGNIGSGAALRGRVGETQAEIIERLRADPVAMAWPSSSDWTEGAGGGNTHLEAAHGGTGAGQMAAHDVEVNADDYPSPDAVAPPPVPEYDPGKHTTCGMVAYDRCESRKKALVPEHLYFYLPLPPNEQKWTGSPFCYHCLWKPRWRESFQPHMLLNTAGTPFVQRLEELDDAMRVTGAWPPPGGVP